MIRKACRTIRERLSGARRTRDRGARGAAGACGAMRHACSLSWKLFQTKTTIGMIEITIRITAIAEP